MGKENIVCGKRVIKEVIKEKINIEILYISKNLNKEGILDIINYVKEIGGEIKEVYSNDIGKPNCQAFSGTKIMKILFFKETHFLYDYHGIYWSARGIWKY